jgi:cellulose synthase/poly-beta-1,6-N-acetylglucosamine synthase-like glycosyltransferase
MLGLYSKKLPITLQSRSKCAIVIPAHNEEAGILKTIESAKCELSENDIIIVVADNCDDRTAEVCLDAGVFCTERFNKELVGKGHALQHGIDYARQLDNNIRTIVIMDADCIFDNGSLNKLVSVSEQHDCVAQALYLMRSPNKDNPKTNISEFTWLIKNWVRPLGQSKLGISCHLQGSGMAFPISLLKEHSLASSSIVEDLELGLKIAQSGTKIKFVESAKVYSFFPQNQEGLDTQRQRWEHGHLATVAKMPKLMLKSLFSFRFRVFFQALDAAIPPTILWLIILVLTFIISIPYGLWTEHIWPQVLFLNLIIVGSSLLLCWFKYGQAIIPFSQLKGFIPFLLGKMGLYKAFAKKRETKWVRTKRDDE